MKTLRSNAAAKPVEIKLYTEIFLDCMAIMNAASPAIDNIEIANKNWLQLTSCIAGKGFSTVQRQMVSASSTLCKRKAATRAVNAERDVNPDNILTDLS